MEEEATELTLRRLVAIGVALGGSALAVAIGACSTSPPLAAPPPVDSGAPVSTCVDAGLKIAFNPMYSAFDNGVHTYTIPALVTGSTVNVGWSADPPGMVGMMADPEAPNEILIQTLQAGTATINVRSDDGKCGSATLTIDAVTSADWANGNARYNNGIPLDLSAPPTDNDASPIEQQPGGPPACTSCHGETATGGPFTDVSHTPEQTGGFSDEDLVNLVVHGVFPRGAFFDTNIVPYATWQYFHRWSDIDTPEKQRGIITYLRSLTPVAQKGAPNFGAFGTDGG